MKTQFLPGTLIFLGATWFLTGACRGEQIAGASPALHWQDLLNCELVVVGKYKSHQGTDLALEVVEVLRGKTYKAGDVLPVKLSLAFVVKLSPRYGFPKRPKAEIPRISFAEETGAKVHIIDVIYDAEQPHVYFFPKEQKLFVTHPTQMQLDRRVGWKQALAGKPIEISFRLLYDIDSEMSNQAIVELFKTRERKAIADLVEVFVIPPNGARWRQIQDFSERALITLGDQNGDVYEPVQKALSDAGWDYWTACRLARILARGDSKRALADFKTLFTSNSKVSQNGIIWGMHNLETVEGLEYLLELLVAGKPHTLESLGCLMNNDQPLAVPMVQRAKVQDFAVPRLQKILKSGVLTQEQQERAMFREYFRSLVQVIPHDQLHWYGVHWPTIPPALKTFPDWDRLVYEANGDPEPLLKADLVEGRKLLRSLFAKPNPAWRVNPLILQSLAYHYGDLEMTRQHKKPTDPIIRYRDTNSAIYHRAPFSVFMKMFKGTAKLTDAYWARIAALFPDHAEEFFGELWALIQSNGERHRQFAIYQLKNHFFWDFDLDPKDFPPVTERKLEMINPLLTRMSKVDLLQMRGMLLQHFGIKLEGPPGKGWLPTIHTAAMSWNPTIRRNALHVLSMLEEDGEIIPFANYPIVQRQDALEAHLKRKRDKLKEANHLPMARVQELWQDLGSDNRAKAYAAMQALATTPQSTVPWLRKNLKEPDRAQSDRVVRAIQVLEFSPGPDARLFLEELSAGPDNLWLTHEAKGALWRLRRHWRL